LDIVEQPMMLSMNGTKQGQLGSMVIDHHTTDIVDVSYFFTKIFSDWRAKPKPEEMKRYERILLVEDSAFFRKLMVPVLMARGYEVRTAQDALHALQILEEDQRFNLIITDIDMPKMNGIQFAEKCKTIPALQNIPMIALTANSDTSLVSQGQEAGLLAHVAKSDREKLFDTVISILEHKSLEVA
jgi:two-component system chemotaxis sensor kinase CheA